MTSNLVVVSLFLGRSSADRLPFNLGLGGIAHAPGVLFGLGLFFTVLMVVVPYLTLRRVPLGHKVKRLLLAYLFLTFWMAASLVTSPLELHAYAVEKALLAGPGVLILLLVLVVVIRFNDPHHARVFFSTLVMWSLALAILSSAGHAGRLAALGGGPNVFGRFMVIGALASLSLWEDSRLHRHLIVSAVLWVFALLSQSRGVFAGILAVLVVFALGKMGGLTSRRARRAGLLAILVPAIVIAVALSLPTQGSSRLRVRLVDYLVADLPSSLSVDARVQAFELAVGMFQDRPLTGWGPGSFGMFGAMRYPHNLVAETVAELGLVGLVALMAYVWTSLTARLVSPRPSQAHHGYASLIAVFCLASVQFSGDFFDSRLFFFFGMVTAALVDKPLAVRPPRRVPSPSRRGPAG